MANSKNRIGYRSTELEQTPGSVYEESNVFFVMEHLLSPEDTTQIKQTIIDISNCTACKNRVWLYAISGPDGPLLFNGYNFTGTSEHEQMLSVFAENVCSKGKEMKVKI